VFNSENHSEFDATIGLPNNQTTASLATWVQSNPNSPIDDPIAAFLTQVGSIERLTTTIQNKPGVRVEETRAYFNIPASGVGSQGTNYDRTKNDYDPMGRLFRVTQPSGTIVRSEFEPRGLAFKKYVGTDDPDGGSFGPGNMELVWVGKYDGVSQAVTDDGAGGTDEGDPSASECYRIYEALLPGPPNRIFRDVRGRIIVVSRTAAPHVFYERDNLGRVTAVGLYDNVDELITPDQQGHYPYESATYTPRTFNGQTSHRLALAEFGYDEQGRLFKKVRHNIGQVAGQDLGQDLDNLVSLTWYDAAGRVVKQRGERLIKYRYDRLGRATHEFELAKDDASRTRQEIWTLTQTGNWSNHKLDRNGNNTFTDSGDLDETGTFNTVNEVTQRDLYSNGQQVKTPAHDRVGNMTDDGEAYKYVYDPFGRLVKVLKRANPSQVVAQYTYDGMGQLIAARYDTNGNGSITDEPTERYVYDARWRIVAVYVTNSAGNSTVIKERYVRHNAGLDGLGGASYIDEIVLRDRDVYAPATLEERVYYCQNAHHDVSALVDAGGTVLERVKYWSYGMPRVYPRIDADWDQSGKVDKDDLDVFTAKWEEGDPDCDLNGDGDVNEKDLDLFNEAWGNGWTATDDLSIVAGNRFGYTGHLWDKYTRKYHARHRVYDAARGRFLNRDPLDYFDGVNLYGYAHSAPIANTDALGLCASCGTGSSQPGTTPSQGNPPSSSPGPNPDPPPDITIEIDRQPATDKSQPGRITVTSPHLPEKKVEGDTLEQPPGERDLGKGAGKKKYPVPPGKYKGKIRKDEDTRFSYDCIELLQVPGFTDILIHSGNEPKDTTGCIIVGTCKKKDRVDDSRKKREEIDRFRDDVKKKIGKDPTIEIIVRDPPAKQDPKDPSPKDPKAPEKPKDNPPAPAPKPK